MITPRSKEVAAPASAQASGVRGSCKLCRGWLRVVVRVVPQTDGQPTTYYACDGCGQVLVRKS